MKSKIIFLLLLFVTFNTIQAQDKPISKNAISAGIGLGSNEGLEETGFGTIFSLGYQRSFGKKGRLRLNPNLVYGSFSSALISDVGEQKFRVKSLEINANYDIVRYRAVSLFLTLGSFVANSSGTFSSGGELSNPADYPKNFNHTYSGLTTGFGIGIQQPDFPIILQIKILNLQIGKNEDYDLGYFMIGASIKI